jgi:glycosyltransferase involved in cell wall biosynthesis
MIAAFALAKEDRHDLKLVLAGSAGHQFEDIKKIISENKLENEVIITGYVAQEDLPIIYNQAEIFLFPTLYEGFGLPILESMASGVPVLTSNFAPHTEVGGDAAYYADSHSPQAMADGIIKILIDSELRQALINKGLARAKEFSWRKTAEEIYKIIKT